MTYVGLSNEQKKEVIEFNHTHLKVGVFLETEAINEAEEAIQETSWNCDVILELRSYFTKSGNPETLNLGMVNDFYICDDNDEEFNIGDLVWSEYYNRLGAISSIITDGDYSIDDPGYTLRDPASNRDNVVCGCRKITRVSQYPNVHFKLIKIANGYTSIRNKK